MDLNNWHVIRIVFQGNQINYTYDGSNLYSVPYTNRICNLLGFDINLKGSGQVDYTRIYDINNNLIWDEEFNDCNHLAGSLKCSTNYSVLSNSPVCEGDSLKLFATGSIADSSKFMWTGPNGFTSTEGILL